MSRSAVVIGGTGFIGRHITQSLAQHGFDVHVVSRNTPPEAGTWIKADRDELTVSCTAWDVVVDNIAFNATQINRTLRCFPQARHFMLNSSIAVYRYCKTPLSPFTEGAVDYSHSPVGENLDDVHWKYARGKLQCEAALIASQKPHTIMRPTLVLGYGDVTQRTQWYVRRLSQRIPIRVPSPAYFFQLVSPIDVGHAFGLAAHAQSEGAFNLATPQPLTVHTFAQALADTLNVPFLTDESAEQGPYSFPNHWLASVKRAQTLLGWQPRSVPALLSECVRP